VVLDIDSMDALNIPIAVDAELSIDIPERDCAKRTTLHNIVSYLSAALAAAPKVSSEPQPSEEQ
jgi:acyl carrier protein